MSDESTLRDAGCSFYICAEKNYGLIMQDILFFEVNLRASEKNSQTSVDFFG